MISTKQRRFGARAFQNVCDRIDKATLAKFYLCKTAWRTCKEEEEARQVLEDERKTLQTMRQAEKNFLFAALDAKQEEALPFLQTLFDLGTQKRTLSQNLRKTFWRWQQLTAQEKRARRAIANLVAPKPKAKQNGL